MMTKKITRVAAGILLQANGQFLLASRPIGKPYAGYWEFPGGKLEQDESALAALKRELSEELGIDVIEATPWLCQRFDYPHASVELYFFRVSAWAGELHAKEGQSFAWQTPLQLNVSPILPANGPILRGLSLPTTLLISPAGLVDDDTFIAKLSAHWQHSNASLLLREPQRNAEQYAQICARVAQIARPLGAKLIGHGQIEHIAALPVDGIHLTSSQLGSISARPLGFDWVGASTHNQDQLAQVQALGLDYACLGHVNPTASHPDQAPLGWDQFAQLLAHGWAFPCFAIGGQTRQTLAQAQAEGAHGVAILSEAWR
jgi:8-oxo-dGTP diphosphatase